MSLSNSNTSCPCGSGRRYTDCCLGHEREVAIRRHDYALDELSNGRPAAAVTALKQALELDENRVAAHTDLGLALRELGRLDEAEVAYRDALCRDTACAVAHQSLGELLHLRGRFQEARQCFESALRINPALDRSRISLGDTLIELGELEAAAGCYREILARKPVSAEVQTRLGLALWKLGDSAGALAAFERAVAESPAAAEMHYNLGSALLDVGRFEEAVVSARDALRLRPGFTQAVTLCAAGLAACGSIEAGVELLRQSCGRETLEKTRYMALAGRLMSSRLFEPAQRCLERAVQDEPGDAMARHLLGALSGANPARPTQGYVRQLFDTSAATFDLEVGSKLGYAIPLEMVEALRAVEVGPSEPWSVLDLGCGTGLVGVRIAPYSRDLVGVDVAPNMIACAHARRIYSELRCEDLMVALARDEDRQGSYDVVTAADVFIYVGKLDDVIPAVRRVLNPGGLFAFSAEAAEDAERDAPAGYRLGLMGRYAHTADYLRQLAERNGFGVELLRKTRIRFEHRRPVVGWLTVWRALI